MITFRYLWWMVMSIWKINLHLLYQQFRHLSRADSEISMIGRWPFIDWIGCSCGHKLYISPLVDQDRARSEFLTVLHNRRSS